MAASTSGNIVVEWLRSLHLGQYAESFIDNGYDDLEICKQVGEPDLDAIGVLNPTHRQRLLHSVRTLREEGAAAVYFTLEEAAAVRDSCRCEEEARKEQASACSVVEPAKYADEYEEGKAELVKIPRIQLKRLLRERLMQDGIRLSLQPYSTTDGDRGYLEGLASRYADLFSTHYGDVLDHLEELRRHEWDEMSPRMRVLGGPGTPQTPPSASPGALALNNLTTSHSQPIYVPGKYSPSSCLTDKEEDDIYGFGYGVFGKQMLQRQQQQKQLLLAQPTQPLIHNQQHNYQSCLSPRSAYFYEFPPSGVFVVDNCLGTAKKKVTTFSRLLRGLKSHRKEKHGSCSPKHTLSPRQGLPPQRLKVQEAMKKKDKLQREQEEILRDIRHGLMNMGRDGVRGPFGGTQALVRAGSNHSSLSAEENIELSPAGRSLLAPQLLCRARALVDFMPSIYEKDALRYKQGDIIDVINMNASGIWRGVLNNKVGNFKFANVEVLSDREAARSRGSSKWRKSRERLWETRPRTVEELLRRIDLPEYTIAFARNGYEDIELFKEIEPSDLDYLGIMTPEHRTRILAAVQLLHQLECGEAEAEVDGGGSSSEGGDSPFGRRQFPRDSGCYEAGVGVGGVRVRTSPLVHRTDEPSHRPPEPVPQTKRSIRRRPPDEAECDKIERYPGPTERTVNRAGGLPGGARDDTCESDHRLNVVKFIAGGEPCASEKSSDSGVSSSSLSSAHPHRP